MFLPVTGMEQMNPVTPQPPSSSLLALETGIRQHSSVREDSILSALSMMSGLRFMTVVDVLQQVRPSH